MRIRFRHMIIDNFMSIGHGEIDLENKGYTLIEGINNNPSDNATSNGSGKSSIFNALCFALTGETIQGISSNLRNIYTDKDLRVELDFSIDNDDFKVIRSRDTKDKPNLKLFINNEDRSGKGVRESEEQLRKYLPSITSELLGEVIIIGQGMPHKFSNNTPSGRKEILEKLSNNDVMMSDIRDRIDARLTKLEDKRNSLMTLNTTLQTKQSMLNKQRTDNERKLEELTKSSNRDFDKEIEECELKIESLQLTRDRLKKEIDEKEEKYLLDSQVSIGIAERKNKELQEEESTFKQYNEPIVKQLNESKVNLTSLNKEITRLSSITDICPTCHQKIQGVHKPDLTEQYKERDSLSALIEELTEKDNKQREAYRLNCEDITNRSRKGLDDLQESLNRQKKDIDLIRANYNDVVKEINSQQITLNNLRKDKDILSSRIQETKDNMEAIRNSLESINSQLLYNISDMNNIQNHLDVVGKIRTLVKRDFRGILLSNVIAYINLKAKEYSKEIFGNEDIEFALGGNNIDITYCNKPLDNLSGGEQQKIDLIIQFAIRSMMQEYTGFNSNIIVLDEILDNLDARGCDEVINFITNRLSDIESIFIISHHADSLNISNDSTIKVIKNNLGISYIDEE